MLNKAIKEIMTENGVQAKTLCVAMGQLESTFSRMFMKDDSDPKSSSIELLARRLNINISDIYLKAESMRPRLKRFFYSDKQKTVGRGLGDNATYVYNGSEWVEYTECMSTVRSSNWDDVVYLGEFPEWHIKINGKVQCPDLYKQLCDEIRNSK